MLHSRLGSFNDRKSPLQQTPKKRRLTNDLSGSMSHTGGGGSSSGTASKSDDERSIDDGSQVRKPFLEVAVDPASQASNKATINRGGKTGQTNYQSNVSTLVRGGLLIALCLQNSVYSLLRRFAVRMSAARMAHAKDASDNGLINNGNPSDSSILIGGELIKLCVSLIMISLPSNISANSPAALNNTSKSIVAHLTWVMKLSPKMMVPALVYYAMNRLSFVSLSRIDAGTFTVCAQMKTATTALFSWLIIGRKFSGPRIRALIHMICSVVVISHFAATQRVTKQTSQSESAEKDEERSLGEFLIGLGAVLLEVTLSGGISVFYEKVLKDDIVRSGLTIWDRNIQLAAFSIILYSPTFVKDGFFVNWTPLTIVISILGAAGGLMVAFSMKYTDAILKALATSGAIVVTAFAGALWLDAPFGVPVVASSVSVVIAILTYVTDGKFASNLCAEERP